MKSKDFSSLGIINLIIGLSLLSALPDYSTIIVACPVSISVVFGILYHKARIKEGQSFNWIQIGIPVFLILGIIILDLINNS